MRTVFKQKHSTRSAVLTKHVNNYFFGFLKDLKIRLENEKRLLVALFRGPLSTIEESLISKRTSHLNMREKACAFSVEKTTKQCSSWSRE